MTYRVIADTAMVLHFGFLAYLVVGGFIAWRWRWTIWPHIVTAGYGLGIVVIGWDCPLTHVENWGRANAGQETLPTTGFIDHYLTGIIYPEDDLALAQGAAAVAVVASWIGFVILGRRRRRARTAA